ncbi:MAG: CHASE2 domain-containing protein [Deltaproteobacteria bacterium]|nr:CHASE2 domain-containing protein [Deltaproteobacteria bacterium]
MAKRIINLDLVIGTIIVLIFMGLTYKKVPFLETVERYAYDAETRFSQGQKRDSSEIVLIDIDDKSFSKLGSWPWPRDVVAEMINNLTKSGA